MTIQGVGSAVKLLLRSLVPSPISLMVAFLVGLVLVGVHLLTLSLSGQAYPTNLNDVLLSGYANYIIGPATRVLYSNWANILLLGAAWGAVGLVLYEVVVHFVGTVHDIKQEDEAVNVPAEGVVRRHPLEGYVLVHIAWRAFITVLSLVLTMAILPVIHFCLSTEQQIFKTTSAWHSVRVVLLSVVLWMAISHCYLVLLRWYMFRTRVTGEILY